MRTSTRNRRIPNTQHQRSLTTVFRGALIALFMIILAGIMASTAAGGSSSANSPGQAAANQLVTAQAPVALQASASVAQVKIENISATDGANSLNAARLVDGQTGTDDASSWENITRWHPDTYPMTTQIDLGDTVNVTGIRYFVGNLTQGSDSVVFEYSPDATGATFLPLATVSDGHQWNAWSELAVNHQLRRIQVRFDSAVSQFNISEIEVLSGATPPTTTPPTTTPPSTTPTSVSPTTATPTTESTTSTTTGSTTTTTTGGPMVDQPKAAVPGPGIVRAYGFGHWPKDHLSAACQDLHDRYWVQGQNAGQNPDPAHPDNQAFPTWHPAVENHPETGERCDYGHEHGTKPTLAGPEVFALSGGWPAFGYAAAHAAWGQPSGNRHEDHVGHKVTVAKFRASIGNAAGPDTLYDAGFECTWLSKVHQGSHSMDAFSNHLHEYFLTVQCLDGLDATGVMNGQTIGTSFSVKLLYTYGLPNTFVEDNCWGDETPFSFSILTGPEGQPAPPASRVTPVGNNSPNNRAFVCSSGVIWNDPETQVQNVDIWNELIKIIRPDGETALTIQPYYIVKNPARIIEGYDRAAGEQPSKVVRTIDICFADDGARLDRPFCVGAPATRPNWQSPESPFNGTLRAVHFKSSDLRNASGPTAFCTDAFGHQTSASLPCPAGSIEQRMAQFTNHWNDGQYSYAGRSGNIQGSIWAEIPFGRRTSAPSNGNGGYVSQGVGFEFIVDNRNPDDNQDGVPDGANIRGQN